MIIIKSMFDRIVYLNDNVPPQNTYVLTNCVNIINQIYKDLREKYRIPRYIDKSDVFEQYLKDNENIDEIYFEDLPRACKAILNHNTIMGTDGKIPDFLNRRIRKLQEFFGLN